MPQIRAGHHKLTLRLIGENNGMWKGARVSNGALHDYIKYHLPKPSKCQICKKNPPYDLANKSGRYKRDLNDWYWLCRSCHMKSDGRMFRRDEKGRFYSKEEAVIAAVPASTR